MKKAAASRTARGTCSGCLELGGGSLPGEFHKSAKAIGVVDGDGGEHLAVHVDLGLLQAVDQLRVAHALLPGGGVDPGDPEPPEVPLAGAPVAVRVGVRAHALLVREPIARMLASEIALGAIESLLLAPLAGVWLCARSLVWSVVDPLGGGPGYLRRSTIGRSVV